MAKGSSKAGGGGSKAPIQKGAAKVEGDNHTVDVRMDDGTHKEVNVSIQDTSQYDDLQGKDYISRVDGRREVGPLTRSLASEAERNAVDGKRENYMTEPTAKEGKFTKTNEVPIMYQGPDAVVINKTEGYATKINGGNLYLHKSTTGGWQYNYKGVSVGNRGRFSSLAAAKAGLGEVRSLVEGLGEKGLSTTKAMFNTLNKNKGRIARSVWKEIDFGYVGGRTYD